MSKLWNICTQGHFHPAPLEIPSIDTFVQFIQEIAMSLSGRIDIGDYNTFLIESTGPLLNSMELFQNGFFDAVFYSMRAAMEVSTVGLYFADIPGDIAAERRSAWVKKEYFPVFSKVMNSPKIDGTENRAAHSFLLKPLLACPPALRPLP